MGDRVTILPSGRSTAVSRIVTFDGDLESAHAGQSVTLTLAEEVDVSRGDLISAGDSRPQTANAFDATLVWLNEKPSELNRRYRLKHAAREESAEVKELQSRININTLDREPAAALEMNAIGFVRIVTARPMVFDSYLKNRSTGSFVLIDPVTNATVAAGMILNAAAKLGNRSGAAHTIKPVSPGERVARWHHTGVLIRLGGRVELAWRLERLLFEKGCAAFAVEQVDEATAPMLLQAGLLVITTGSLAQGFSIETVDGKADSSASSLPPDDQDAVEAIERVLERLQIVLAGPNFSESGGI